MTTFRTASRHAITLITLLGVLGPVPRLHAQHTAGDSRPRALRAEVLLDIPHRGLVPVPVLELGSGCRSVQMAVDPGIATHYVRMLAHGEADTLRLRFDVRDSANQVKVYTTTLAAEVVGTTLTMQATRAPVLEMELAVPAARSDHGCDIRVDVIDSASHARAHMLLPIFAPAPPTVSERSAVCITVAVSGVPAPVVQERGPCPERQTPVDDVQLQLESHRNIGTGLPIAPELYLFVRTGNAALRKVLDAAEQRCASIDLAVRAINDGKLAPLVLNASSVDFIDKLSGAGGRPGGNAACAPRPHRPGEYRLGEQANQSKIELLNLSTSDSAVVHR